MTMKTPAIALASCAFLALTSASTAGSLTDPVVEPPVAIVEKTKTPTDWQGFRGGLGFNAEIANHTLATSEGFP